MEQNESANGSQTKAELWEQRIRGWEVSGLSQIEFCRRHSLKLATFAYWRKRFPTIRNTHGTLRLVPLGRQPASESATRLPNVAQMTGITLEFNGVCLKVYPDFDETTLQRLLCLLGKS